MHLIAIILPSNIFQQSINYKQRRK
jgi:hypothetical protein